MPASPQKKARATAGTEDTEMGQPDTYDDTFDAHVYDEAVMFKLVGTSLIDAMNKLSSSQPEAITAKLQEMRLDYSNMASGETGSTGGGRGREAKGQASTAGS